MLWDYSELLRDSFYPSMVLYFQTSTDDFNECFQNFLKFEFYKTEIRIFFFHELTLTANLRELGGSTVSNSKVL